MSRRSLPLYVKIFLICLKLDVPEVEEGEIELPKETLDRRENVEIWKSKNVTEAIGNIKSCNVIGLQAVAPRCGAVLWGYKSGSSTLGSLSDLHLIWFDCFVDPLGGGGGVLR